MCGRACRVEFGMPEVRNEEKQAEHVEYVITRN